MEQALSDITQYNTQYDKGLAGVIYRHQAAQK